MLLRQRPKPRITPPKRGKLWAASRFLSEAIDCFIEPLSPSLAVSRRSARLREDLAFERLSHDYHRGAANDRLRADRWMSSSLSPDSGMEDELETMQIRCADLYRNNSIAGSAVEGRVTYEVGEGLKPQSKIRADELGLDKESATALRRRIEDGLDDWSDSGVNVQRTMSLDHFERLACRTFAIFGEVFVEIAAAPTDGPIGLALNIIDPRRVATPFEYFDDENVKLGVRYSDSGQILGYYVRKNNPGDDYQSDDSYTFVQRYGATGDVQIVHVFEQVVPEQSRGISWLANAMNEMLDHEDYREYEMVTKQVEACFGVIIKKSADSTSPVEAAEAARSGSDSNGSSIQDIEPGSVQYIESDEDVVTVDPNRPGATYAPFVETSLRSISASLNFPYEILAKNFYRTTYSSGRLGILDGRMGFRMRRRTLVTQLLRPVYRAAATELAMSGYLEVSFLDFRDNKAAYCRHTWEGRDLAFLDPEKEMKAYVIGRDNNMLPLASVYAETADFDWEEGLAQIHREKLYEMRLEIERRAEQQRLEIEHGLIVRDDPEAKGDGDDAKGKEENSQRKDDKARLAELERKIQELKSQLEELVAS